MQRAQPDELLALAELELAKMRWAFPGTAASALEERLVRAGWSHKAAIVAEVAAGLGEEPPLPSSLSRLIQRCFRDAVAAAKRAARAGQSAVKPVQHCISLVRLARPDAIQR